MQVIPQIGSKHRWVDHSAVEGVNDEFQNEGVIEGVLLVEMNLQSTLVHLAVTGKDVKVLDLADIDFYSCQPRYSFILQVGPALVHSAGMSFLSLNGI